MSQGVKVFNNRSQSDVDVTLLIRAGSDPSEQAGEQNIRLKAGESRKVTYGTDTDSIFLNGLRIVAEVNGSIVDQTQRVSQRGSSFDNVLNTNNTITITGTDQLDVVGSNG